MSILSVFASEYMMFMVSPNEQVLHHEAVCSTLSFAEMDLNKCIRSFLYQWCNVLMVKMLIMMFMPILIMIRETVSHRVWGKKRKIEIDSEYTMITTKLEIIFVFGVFCPLLYPLILVSMNSFIFFYVLAAKKLKWNMTFLNHEHGLESFPFPFLIFGILCEQVLTLLFMASDGGYVGWEWLNQAISWTVLVIYFVIDVCALYLHRKRASVK